jgi:predicted nucleic acid-binding protein
MIAVFLDTAGLLALWDMSDQWHAAADKAYSQLREDRRGLVTTTFVLLECGHAAARRPYRAAVDELRQRMESSGMLITPGEEDWREAWAAYRRGELGRAGIVDHVSFAVMRRLGLSDAFTHDHHFRAAGFQTLF